jgi:hypothetical protein
MKEVYFYKKGRNVGLDYKFHFFEDLRAVVEAGVDSLIVVVLREVLKVFWFSA